MRDSQLFKIIRPFVPAFERAMFDALAEASQMRGGRLMPTGRKGERKQIMHWLIRENLRVACDELSPFLTMCQERDGMGLDYITVTSGSSEIAVRWSPFTSERGFPSSNSERQEQIEETGNLYAEDTNEIPFARVGYELRNDHVEVGEFQGEISRLVLWREGAGFLTTLRAYPQSATITRVEHPKSRRIIPSERSAEEMRRVASEIRRMVS